MTRIPTPRRRGLHILRFRLRRKLTHSVAPPFPFRTALLGSERRATQSRWHCVERRCDKKRGFLLRRKNEREHSHALLRRQPEISAPAKGLLEKIDPAGAEGLTPNSFSHRIRKSVDALRRNGITVSFRKSNGDRLICLKRADGVDDPAAENIVTIDSENALCFAL